MESEYGSASNIKDRENRQSVQCALRSAIYQLKQIKVLPKNGIAIFRLLKDYFPEWDKFDRRHKNKFLLTATYTDDVKGEYLYDEYTKVKHTATYESIYYPGNSEYKSYAYGLLAATTTALVSGFVIYWYRKRREKPFKEVKFD